jgi:mono/diheme cytochrome c family protein
MSRILALILFIVGSAVFLLGCQAMPTDEPVTINGITVPPAPPLSLEMVDQGETLYLQYCASCHGGNLEGAPNWKLSLPDGSFPPPPQDSTGHTWHHSDTVLLNIIAEGGDPEFGGTMPSYGDILTEEEIASVLDFFKSKWGKNEREFQWWVTNTR